MTRFALAAAALLAFSALPVVGLADACINSCNPIVGACAGGVTAGTCGDGDDVCVWFASGPPLCREGPGDSISCGDPIVFGFWAAGVDVHDCSHVDGYVCTDARYFGGGGGGPIGNWVCFDRVDFSLP